MQFASSVPYFKAALVARLAATTALATGTTTVSRGNPYPKRWANEAVLVGGMSNYQQRLVGGLTQRREEYDVEITANVAGSAQDPYEDFESRAYVLAAAVETSLTEWTRTGEILCSGAWGHAAISIPTYVSDQEGIDIDDNATPRSRDATVRMSVHVIAVVRGYGS